MCMQRIRIEEIKKHPWFLNSSSEETMDSSLEDINGEANGGGDDDDKNKAWQSVEQVLAIIQEAREATGPGGLLVDDMDEIDFDGEIDEEEEEDDDMESSGDFICAFVS
ncbi:unnamed protein product [Cuscuta campestris]|uniref:Uncharacterized protein n=1 Tax=Cuscuta campestris TaxID=132261 RepID=A0A484NEV2_9ASTE|nr:unnamed protein product [Cuscuta campestris]